MRNRKSRTADPDVNMQEEEFYDQIEEDDNDYLDERDTMGPPEGTEYNEDEDDYFSDVDDDDSNALDDGYMIDGEESSIHDDDTIEDKIYREAEDDDD